MKAMLLAAGRGSRMGALTDETPKPLLEVNGKSLIVYQIERLARAGVTDVMINASYQANKLIATLGNGRALGVKLHFSVEPTILGTAGGVVQVLDFFEDQPFLLTSSDIWTDFDYSRLNIHANALGHIVLVENPPHHPEGDFHLTATGRVLNEGVPKLNYAGIGLYHPAFFNNTSSGYLPLKDLLLRAMDKDLLTGELFKGYWRNIDTPERLESLENDLRPLSTA